MAWMDSPQRASSFRRVNREVVGDSSMTSSLKATYQQLSHRQSGGHCGVDSYSELQHKVLRFLRPPHAHSVEICLISP